MFVICDLCKLQRLENQITTNYPNVNFDFQPKIKAQRNPMPIPENTVQFDMAPTTSQLNDYKVDSAFIKNGQKNYNIYCAACHTKTGNGLKSNVTKSGWIVSNLLKIQHITALILKFTILLSMVFVQCLVMIIN